MTTKKSLEKTTRHCFASLAMTVALLFTATAPVFAQLQVCANQGFALVSAEPASGIEPITYEWYENGIPINNSNTASISIAAGKATAGTYQYVRKAANSACTLSTDSYTVEVLAAPVISITGGNASQTVTMPMAVSPITYTAANAASIFLSSGTLPLGVIGSPSGTSFTISGTPSATGTYAYAVTATTASGCSFTIHGSFVVETCAVNGIPYFGCTGITAVACSYTMISWRTAITRCAEQGNGWHLPSYEEMDCLKDEWPNHYPKDNTYATSTWNYGNEQDPEIWNWAWFPLIESWTSVSDFDVSGNFCVR
jgi:hypothetical protein